MSVFARSDLPSLVLALVVEGADHAIMKTSDDAVIERVEACRDQAEAELKERGIDLKSEMITSAFDHDAEDPQ